MPRKSKEEESGVIKIGRPSGQVRILIRSESGHGHLTMPSIVVFGMTSEEVHRAIAGHLQALVDQQ